MPDLVRHHALTPAAKRHEIKSSVRRIRGRKLQERNARLAARYPLCVHCQEQGRIAEATEWDHIVPLHKGGQDIEKNLQGLCHDCHAVKTAQDMGYELKPRIGVDGWPVPSAPDRGPHARR